MMYCHVQCMMIFCPKRHESMNDARYCRETWGFARVVSRFDWAQPCIFSRRIALQLLNGQNTPCFTAMPNMPHIRGNSADARHNRHRHGSLGIRVRRLAWSRFGREQTRLTREYFSWFARPKRLQASRRTRIPHEPDRCRLCLASAEIPWI